MTLTFTLNGKQVTTQPGKSILEAAKENGVFIPHFCYHPYLSIDGCCRMCMIEVLRIPKLVISCNTIVSEGMVVFTNTPRVENARKNTLEFLLLNHPVDCPICDQAGECTLQEFAFNYGTGISRFEGNKRKGLKRQRIGKNIIYDQERCILCRRCIRFCREISKTGELGMIGRGDQSHINIFTKKFIENPYSINTVDICPVGALTDANFRFKTRVWFLKDSASVCPGCSNNCNISVNHHNGKILRVKPRENENINDTWICDYGRTLFQKLYSEDRLLQPQFNTRQKRDLTSWLEAFRKIAEYFQKYTPDTVAAIASPNATNEEFYIFRKLVKGIVKSNNIACHIPTWQADDFLIKEEKAANAYAVREVLFHQLTPPSIADILQSIKHRKITMLYVCGNEFLEYQKQEPKLLTILDQLEVLIVQASEKSALSEMANIVLPSALYFEKEGTYTNINGYVQKTEKIAVLSENMKTDIEIYWGISNAMKLPFPIVFPEQAMFEISRTIPKYKNVSYDQLSKLKVIKTLE